MFYYGPAITCLVIGLLFIILSLPSINKMFSSSLNPLPSRLVRVGYIWQLRISGVILIIVAVLILMSGPSTGILYKRTNRLLLLEQGQITEGQINKLSYRLSGWAAVYLFEANDPASNQKKIYWGTSRGPKAYYNEPGKPISIIYLLSNPRVNYEIKSFLNDPSFRNTFKKADKLELLNKYRDKYPIENYSSEEWRKLHEQK
jgi:hypothetical protein